MIWGKSGVAERGGGLTGLRTHVALNSGIFSYFFVWNGIVFRRFAFCNLLTFKSPPEHFKNRDQYVSYPVEADK